jgi:hypothetical protein
MTDTRLYLLGLGTAAVLALLGTATILIGMRGRSTYTQSHLVPTGRGMLLTGAGLSITAALVFLASTL